MTIGLLILRSVVGALFVGHGVQKLFGWLGGHGIEGTADFMDSLRYRNGRMAAVLAGLTESVAGSALVFGLLTPLAAAAIIGVMVNASTVHVWNGLWNANGGIELPLVYAAAAAALAFAGPGSFSLDRALGLDLTGLVFGVGAVVLGVATGLATLAWRRPEPAGQPDETVERNAA
jgi:putative oxidoreductase